MTTTQTDEIKTWQQRLEETCPAIGPMHIHACVEEVNDAMQAEIDDLRAALQEQAPKRLWGMAGFNPPLPNVGEKYTSIHEDDLGDHVTVTGIANASSPNIAYVCLSWDDGHYGEIAIDEFWQEYMMVQTNEQAREGEAVAWSDDALNRAYSDGVAYGERNYRQAIATYQAEASGYKDAYFKLVESIANLKVFEPAPPIIIAAPQEARAVLLAALQEQAREGEGEQEPIARIMFNDDGRKTDNLIDCDLPVGTLLYAAPQPAQPESIECDCGRIHKKTRYGWACSEPAQPDHIADTNKMVPADHVEQHLDMVEQPEQGEREEVIELLKQGAAISRDRGINLDFAKIADRAANLLQSAQPVAQPLTDEQIDAFWNQQLTVPQIVQRRVIARAIEAAHGIGGAL